MSRDLSALCFIREQTSEPASAVGYTMHKTDDPSRFYLKFKTSLQSFGIVNRNRRAYDAENIRQCIESSDYIQSMLRQNSWVGELDHPQNPNTEQKLTVQRLANPDPSISSHYIRKPWFEGNILKAPIQTDSSNANGMNLAIKIVDGKIIPAFSARVLGELKNINGVPTVHVKRLITYDSVLYPSHPEALGDIKQQQLMESAAMVEEASGSQIIYFPELAMMAAHNSKEVDFICESFGLTVEDVLGVTASGKSVVLKEGANVYVQPITDKIIRSKTQDAARSFLGGGLK